MPRWPEPSKEKPKKFEVVFEDDDCISIWKYDKIKFPNGPISVEYKWKPQYLKRIKDFQKNNKELKTQKKKGTK